MVAPSLKFEKNGLRIDLLFRQSCLKLIQRFGARKNSLAVFAKCHPMDHVLQQLRAINGITVFQQRTHVHDKCPTFLLH